jgi:LmbE family N-acetylglucosaminyl deacetylase
MRVNPIDLLTGTILIAIPHMDDGILAAGGAIATLSDKDRIHIVYATDGMKSPDPILPWRDQITPELGKIRMQEACNAMQSLGIAQEHIHFLALPDGQLSRHKQELNQKLEKYVSSMRPQTILVPFRYDRHPDHLTLNHVLTAFLKDGRFHGKLVEYFVYHHWRLLPGGDVRKYIRPELLAKVDTSKVSKDKRQALEFFKSQTTCFYPWQTRPNLTPKLLDNVSKNPEFFLRFDASLPGHRVFNGNVFWIRIAHRVEPFLKKRKDRALAIWSRRGDFGR